MHGDRLLLACGCPAARMLMHSLLLPPLQLLLLLLQLFLQVAPAWHVTEYVQGAVRSCLFVHLRSGGGSEEGVLQAARQPGCCPGWERG
jgi:hypothetical protein